MCSNVGFDSAITVTSKGNLKEFGHYADDISSFMKTCNDNQDLS